MKILYRILFLVVFLGLVPLACEKEKCEDPCGCGDGPKISQFEIKDMGLRPIETDDHTDIDTAQYYHVSKIAIAVSITDQRNIALQSPKSTFSFTSSAYACSPIGPRSNQFIENVIITAANTVTYKAQTVLIKKGDTITDLFIFDLYSPHPANSESLEEFLSSKPTLDGYGSFYFRLNPAPYQPTTLVIDVEVTLSDGQIFKFEDEILKVK